MVSSVAQSALVHWGLKNAGLQLIAQRENTVFLITHNENNYALRLHRPDYQTFGSVISELKWMASLAQSGINVPKPIPALNGSLLIKHESIHIDLLTWLDGDPLGTTGAPLQVADRVQTFYEIGQLMARLHEQADNWILPIGFERARWDHNGLLGEAPLWGRFWENPNLTSDQAALFSKARNKAREILNGSTPDFGLIHADMVRENILIGQNGLQLIDFDDCGFGYRLFDVATALIKNIKEPDYEILQSAMIDGYSSLRSLNWDLLPLFLMLRSLTYVGWVVSRINEPGSVERQRRFIRTGIELVQNYLVNE